MALRATIATLAIWLAAQISPSAGFTIASDPRFKRTSTFLIADTMCPGLATKWPGTPLVTMADLYTKLKHPTPQTDLNSVWLVAEDYYLIPGLTDQNHCGTCWLASIQDETRQIRFVLIDRETVSGVATDPWTTAPGGSAIINGSMAWVQLRAQNECWLSWPS
ncbi:hypothetical protein ABW21_db0201649 [Orbilia brochopaga]|nr:hypothetical protein ABW21_db0201649 [Drechslerella brochopaga]